MSTVGKKRPYFDSLNYSLGNEDSELEYRLAEIYQSQFVLAVCGSGGRSLPLIAFKAKHLSLLDISEWQMALGKLRAYTYQYLNYQDFLVFWGYAHNLNLEDQNIKKLRKQVIDDYSKLSFDEGSRWREYFSSFSWESILYNGKWERTFKFLSSLSSFVLGSKACELFALKNLSDQNIYFNNQFPLFRWKIVVFLLGNKSVFNALLYGGSFVQKNIKESYFEHYWQAYQRLFNRILAKESFFLNLCFFGKINFIEGNPWEAQEEAFLLIQKKMQEGISINYLNCSLFDLEAQTSIADIKYDFISLSNVPSYLPIEKQLSFLQDLRPFLSPGAIVVVRYYLNVGSPLLDSFNDITHLHQDLIFKEKVQMYHINIYQYQSELK